MILTENDLTHYRAELNSLGELPPKKTVGMPEDALYRPPAIAFACWEIRDLLDTIADLERQRDTAQGQLVKNAGAYAEALKTLAGSQERAVAEAHAVAIQAAIGCCFVEGIPRNPRKIQEDILALTPVGAQRLYDLRIAEAVTTAYRNAQQLVESTPLPSNAGLGVHLAIDQVARDLERLASASAEVGRLKAPANV